MIKEAAELIKKANRIGVVLPESPDGDALCAAYGLISVLRGAGREASLFFPKKIPERYQFLRLEQQCAATQHPQTKISAPNNLILSINTDQHPIQEVRYEKEGAVFSVIISPKRGNITEKDIEFQTDDADNPSCDLFVAIDIASPEELPSSFDEHLEQFSKKPVVAVTARPVEEFFSDATVTGENHSTLSESTYLLAKELRYVIAGGAATLFLCGIFEKTKNFFRVPPDGNIVATASSLVALGADKPMLIKNLFPEENKNAAPEKPETPQPVSHNLLQLWGRALVRSRYDEASRIVWSFLPRDDFEKTKTESRDILFVAKKMAEHLPLSRMAIFLLENPHKHHIRVALHPRDAMLEEKILRRFGKTIEKKQGLLIFTGAFNGFIEAENCLLEFLSDAA